MIEKDKLTKEQVDRLAAVRGYYDEAHLLAHDLKLTAADLHSVALMLAIIGKK
jgi:hypothetical protein